MNTDHNEKKMTLEEYQLTNESSGNIKSAKSFFLLLIVAIGIAIAFYLFSIVRELFELHAIVGYVGIFLSLFIFMFLYVVPAHKIYKANSFFTSVNRSNANIAKKYNQRLRGDLADKIIDSASKIDGLSWYTDDHIKDLAIARYTKNNRELNQVLSEIYASDIKKTANQLIRNCAVQVGISTAISQSDMIDALLIVIFEFKLVKDLVYLYGYRPSDSQMIKIIKNVLRNSLLAYGISVTAEGITQIVGSVMGSIPYIGVVIQSGVQGIVNSSFAALLGKQTIKYLITEYQLQRLLDEVELEQSIEEDEALLLSIADEVKKNTSKSKASKKTPVPANS